MSTRGNQKQVKIFYLDENQAWQPYAKTLVHLDMQDNTCSLRIILKEDVSLKLLDIVPLTPILSPQGKTFLIEFNRISKAEKISDLMVAVEIEEWNRVLALSFRDQQYCDMISEQIELNTAEKNNLPCPEDQLIDYVAEQIENNPYFVEFFFNSEDVIASFVKQALKHKNSPESKHTRTVFRALKLLLLRADRPSLEIMLKEQYYQQVLLCLSFNYEFGDRTIHYEEEYSNMTNFANVLNITDPVIIQKYKVNTRIKFLIHVATSMFIEPPAEAVLNQILQQNSVALMQFIVNNPQCLEKSNQLALQDPQAFIRMFSQLWEMFKSIIDDLYSISIKKKFKELFVSENIINISFQTVLKLSQQKKGDGRLYQQYLEALNPFLSHKWNQSQELLLFVYQYGKPHILQIILSLLSHADYNLKTIVLLFAKNLIQVTQNRPKMKQAFMNYFFNEFVSKCVLFFETTEELQILVDFYMKLYKIDLLRTRRSIIESELMQKMEKKMQNKYILMLILKLLRFFLQFKDGGVFQYIIRKEMFGALRIKYFEIKKFSPNGIIFSLFIGLMKKAQNREGIKYVNNLMFPSEKIL